MKNRDTFVLAGFTSSSLADSGEPAKVERNQPNFVVRGTGDYYYNRNAKPAKITGNLPEIRGTYLPELRGNCQI